MIDPEVVNDVIYHGDVTHKGKLVTEAAVIHKAEDLTHEQSMGTKFLKVGVPLETDDEKANLTVLSGGDNWECRSAFTIKSVGDGTAYNDKYAENSRLATVEIARKDDKGPDYAFNVYDEGTARGLFSIAYDGQAWLYHNKLNSRFIDVGAYDTANNAVFRASRFDATDVPICQLLE